MAVDKPALLSTFDIDYIWKRHLPGRLRVATLEIKHQKAVSSYGNGASIEAGANIDGGRGFLVRRQSYEVSIQLSPRLKILIHFQGI
jgi:hypothetical protein